MASAQQQLERMREKLERAKQERAEAEGALKQLLKDLEKEFGCKDSASAKKKLEQLQQKRDKLDAEIEEGIAELEDKYDW